MKTETQHTPGPWYLIDERFLHDKYLVSIGEPNAGGTTVCNILSEPGDDFGKCKANARLIAAAPDLLAAVRGMIEAYDNDSIAHLEQASREARAAIAKATGE